MQTRQCEEREAAKNDKENFIHFGDMFLRYDPCLVKKDLTTAVYGSFRMLMFMACPVHICCTRSMGLRGHDIA